MLCLFLLSLPISPSLPPTLPPLEPLLTAEQEDNEDSVGAEDKPTGISCKVLPGEDTQV